MEEVTKMRTDEQLLEYLGKCKADLMALDKELDQATDEESMFATFQKLSKGLKEYAATLSLMNMRG